MLDEELGVFPHVTRSITGLVNAAECASWAWVDEGIQPIYVTRAYATRHGAGELKHERESITLGGSVGDSTNVPNEWQGKIRFAPLDLRELKSFIDRDYQRALATADISIEKPMIALTCLDQLGPYASVYDCRGQLVTPHREDLPAFVTEQLGVTVSMISRGPTSNDVEHLVEIGV